MARAVDPEVLQAFATAPVLAALPATVADDLARRTKVVTLRTHGMLWREGDRATHLGLVLHGRVAVERAQQRRVIVDVAGAGELLGEVALTLGAAYQFDVRCMRKARVALIPAQQLRAILKAQPAVAVALTLELAREVMRLTRRLEALSAGSVRQRLARVLLSLTERFGTPFPGGTLLPVRLRRDDLAALAATTIESASRQVSEWKRQGVLTPQPAGFLVKDLRALRLSGDGETR